VLFGVKKYQLSKGPVKFESEAIEKYAVLLHKNYKAQRISEIYIYLSPVTMILANEMGRGGGSRGTRGGLPCRKSSWRQ
jgi:hypothetical protein